MRVFAYGLRYEYAEEDNSALGTYTFYFKSNVPATSGRLILYYDNDGDDNQNEFTSEVGRFDIPLTVFDAKNDDGEYSFSLSKDQIPVDVTNNNAYLGMTWAIELKAEKIIGQYYDDITSQLATLPVCDEWGYQTSDAHYDLKSYLLEVDDPEHALYYQVREPRLLFSDNNFRCPQGIAIDNNPQSPFFGRVYVANAPTDQTSDLSSSPYDAGVVVYEPDPTTGTYKKVGGSYMPSGVEFPTNVDANTRFYMHRIAVNPVNGNVYYCKSTSSEHSAIYQMIPSHYNTNTPALGDGGTSINVTQKLIQSNEVDYSTNPLHPINSLAFGPGGELYVMSQARGANAKDKKVGEGVIYKLTKLDDDNYYNAYSQYYIPATEPQPTKSGVAKGDPYNINPWVDADNAMVVTARGSFWVTQYRNTIDAYAFLAHIHPKGYIEKKQYGRELSPYFQYVMSTIEEETFSGNVVNPLWSARHMLSPHNRSSTIPSNGYPSGHVAIYEKGGMNSTEAWLAVAFEKKVCVFKLFYNDNHGDWFGFNTEWMFEIPIENATYIDGLAFDYAGNLFVASENTHSLYVYSLPNYGPMIEGDYPPVHPLIFGEDGDRVTKITSDGSTTYTYNNLNRGVPLDDNTTITPAKFSMKVDGAIVYDERYWPNKAEGEGDLTNFDNQWSTKSNWNVKRVPTREDIPVIIRSDALIDEHQSASGVLIESGSKVTVAHNGGLTIGKDGLIGASGDGSTITIENFSTIHPERYSGGAGFLRIHPEVKTMPRVTVYYHTKSQPSEHPDYIGQNAHRLWQYVGAPGESTEAIKGSTTTSTQNTWLYRWVEGTGWVKKKDNDTMIPFTEGYAITQQDAPNYWWTTTAINDNQEIALRYTQGGYKPGDNIFVNSYLAPINVAAFTAEDFTGDVDRTFYLFNTGSFSEWVAASKGDGGAITDKHESGQYTAIPVSSAENFDPTKDPVFIAPMQGVYVQVGENGGTIKLDYERMVWNWQENNSSNNPMRAPLLVNNASECATCSSKLLRRIRIQVFGECSGSDYMYIMQDSRCTPDYDNGYDGRNMIAPGQVNIYSNEPCGKMEVSCSNVIDSMYIGFQSGPDTVYTLRFSSLVGDSLYIKDLQTDSIIALTEESTYTFYAPAKSKDDMRFQVQLNPASASQPGNSNQGTTTSVDNLPNASTVWVADNMIYIVTGQNDNMVVLCDMSGRVILYQTFDSQVQLSVQGMPTGVYVLRVNDEIYKFVSQD